MYSKIQVCQHSLFHKCNKLQRFAEITILYIWVCSDIEISINFISFIQYLLAL